MSTRTLLSASAGASKCRTVDVCDIFGDNSGKALYRLDGNANDESGNYHGTETAITYGGGVYERGAVFNGSSSKVTFSAISTAKCLSFWSNKPLANTDGKPVFGNASPLGYIFYGENSGSYTNETLGIYYNSAGMYITDVINDTTWKHIVIQYIADGNWNIYINGALRTITYTGALGNALSILTMIGSDGGTYFNYPIDQVRIFNRAITATEVATLYAECAPTSTVTDTNPFMDGSLLNKCLLEGNTTSLVGTSPTVTGTVTYGTGKFGQCITGFSVGGSLTFSATGIKTVSMFIAPMTISGDRWIMDNRAVGGTEYFRLNSVGNYDFAGGLTVKKNGIPLATGTAYPTAGIFEHISIELTTARNAVHIGNVNTNNDGNSSNKIDHIELYNKVLTPMEVACLSVQTTPLEEPMHSLVDPFKDGSGKALYRLDGNALDESGNYNGTATSVTYGAGRFGQMGVFGASSKIYISGLQTLCNSAYSYSCWVNSSSFLTTSGIIATPAGKSILLRTLQVGGVNRLEMTSAGGSYVVTYSGATTSTWYHCVVTTNFTNLASLYVNGALIGTITTLEAGNESLFKIGVYYTDPTYHFLGSIDQFRFFNKELTAGEVSTLYTEI